MKRENNPWWSALWGFDQEGDRGYVGLLKELLISACAQLCIRSCVSACV